MDGQQSIQGRRKDSRGRPSKMGAETAVQFNIIIDVLWGWSVDLEETIKDLVGQRSRSVLRRRQNVILSHSLNIARAFKVLI